MSKKWILVLIILGFGATWTAFQWKNLVHFPSIISSFYSKEFCSCYFVMQMSEKQCHNFARQWIPISEFRLDQDAKQVTVSGLGRTTVAKFTDQKFGCVIQGETQ